MYKVSERHIAADKEKERVRIEAEKAKDVGNCISSGKSDSFCRNAFGNGQTFIYNFFAINSDKFAREFISFPKYLSTKNIF